MLASPSCLCLQGSRASPNLLACTAFSLLSCPVFFTQCNCCARLPSPLMPAGLTRLSYSAIGESSAVLPLAAPAEGSTAAAAAADRLEPQPEPPAAGMVSKLQLDALFTHVSDRLE